MPHSEYHPETYWTEVGQRIAERAQGQNVIAGDDEPYYRYKRSEFLNLLRAADFKNKTVLELGCGPGGNLLEVLALHPRKLTAVDISAEMIRLARQKVPAEVEIIKINGTSLPFSDRHFDLVFTATVLQHNTDENMLHKILAELSRVCSHQLILFERIEPKILGDNLCIGRPIQYYSSLLAQHGFQLIEKKFVRVRASYYVSGAIRKLFNPSSRREGEPLNKLSVILQKIALFFTRPLDKIVPATRDVARMTYERV